jgi:hypothetical protein
VRIEEGKSALSKRVETFLEGPARVKNSPLEAAPIFIFPSLAISLSPEKNPYGGR